MGKVASRLTMPMFLADAFLERGAAGSIPRGEQLVVIGPTPPPAHGVSVATRSIVGALRSLGLLTAHLDTRDPRPLDNLGRLDLVNVWLGLKHGVQLIRLLHAHPEAAVYVPISQARWAIFRDALFVTIARVARRRVYLHLHGGKLDLVHTQAGPVLRRAIEWTTGSAHQVWVLTPGLRRVVEGLVERERIRVLENVVEDRIDGPDTKRIADARESPTAPPEFRLLYLSNLVPQKGCFDLLDAVALLGKEAQGWHVRLVGDPRDSEVAAQLVQRAREVSKFARVEVAGPAHGEEKWRELSWADAFVFPGHQLEGQPLVILEALAAGLPIVATRISGIPETARHGREALLVPPGQPSALSDSLVRLSREPQLRSELGRNARARYEERYRPGRLEDDLSRLLAEPAR